MLILLWKISCAKFLLWYFRSVSWLFENSGRNTCISWDAGVPTDVGPTQKGPHRTVPSFGDFHTTLWSLSRRSKAPRRFKIKLACECPETPACRSSCLQELDSSRICGLSLSPGRRRQWEQTTEGEGPTSHVLPWGPVSFSVFTVDVQRWKRQSQCYSDFSTCLFLSQCRWRQLVTSVVPTLTTSFIVLLAAFYWIELFIIIWWPLSSFTVSDFTCVLSGVCAMSYIFFLLYVHGHIVYLSARIHSSGDMNLCHQYGVKSCVFSSRLSFSWKPSPFVFKLITDC